RRGAKQHFPLAAEHKTVYEGGMQSVTLHDIAKRAGVSVATVSLALRGRGEVSHKRAEEIRALAKEMGYRPNPMLAALASKRFSNAKAQQGTPLAIFEFPQMPGQSAPKTNLYRKALMDEAKRLGYAPNYYPIEPDTSPAALYRQIYSRAVQGIVVNGSVDMEGFGAQFDWAPFSIVQCARYWAEYPFHTVRSNIFQSVKLVFTKLRERGYRRIGFAIGRHDVLLEDDEDRHGAAIALENAHLPKKDRLPAYVSAFDDRKAFLAWFDANEPDVVVGFNAVQYWFLRDKGIKIPDDVGFAVLHGGHESDTIAGLSQNTDEIARQSIQQLDLLIRNHERGIAENPIHILLPSTWYDGASLRPVKA
ncbi:MAG TPA: LacI family DNA-binding transcriptional regulator, partial [Kiritimatiellia bacterium]|nr:LacI family DNA-binding transcriptional regulator [Kiritimatiellia bacterium]HMP96815.1 LacI family DNA-binding transcriptional regulator [Kiritimatiellia bacterium]